MKSYAVIMSLFYFNCSIGVWLFLKTNRTSLLVLPWEVSRGELLFTISTPRTRKCDSVSLQISLDFFLTKEDLHEPLSFSAKDNFTFKCHRSNGTNTSAPQDIYAVRFLDTLTVVIHLETRLGGG